MFNPGRFQRSRPWLFSMGLSLFTALFEIRALNFAARLLLYKGSGLFCALEHSYGTVSPLRRRVCPALRPSAPLNNLDKIDLIARIIIIVNNINTKNNFESPYDDPSFLRLLCRPPTIRLATFACASHPG